MTIKKSKIGRIYLNLLNGDDRNWAVEKGLELSEDKKTAFLDEKTIGTLDINQVAGIFRQMNLLVKYDNSAYEVCAEVVEMCNKRGKVLKGVS